MNITLRVELDQKTVAKVQEAIRLLPGVNSVSDEMDIDANDLRDMIREIMEELYQHENPNDVFCPLRALREKIMNDFAIDFKMSRVPNEKDRLIRLE